MYIYLWSMVEVNTLILIANPKFKSWTDSNVYPLRLERDSIEAKSTPVKHTNVAFGQMCKELIIP